MSDLVKELRCLAVNLRDHGTLYFRIDEIFDQRVRRMKCRLDIDELGQRHVGRAMFGRDVAKRRVGDAVHRRESDDRFSYVTPEIHISR